MTVISKQNSVLNDKSVPYKGVVYDDQIDLRKLFGVIWQGKLIIIASTLLCGVIAVYASLKMPNIYKSTATLISATSEEQSGTAALAARFGGLASLAGVSLGGGGSDKAQMAIEILKSHRFLGGFIEKHNLKPEIMAVESWDVANNKIVFNEKVYNEQSREWDWQTSSQWKREGQPTNQEAIRALLGNIDVNQNKDSGLVSISVSHLSPFVAQQWVQWLVSDINQYMREQDIAESEKSIGYLKDKLAKTALAEMQKIFYELIEVQTKTKMLAEIRDQYVLNIIDPPRVPELKDKPKRAIMCVLAVLFGGMFGALIVLLRWELGREYAVKDE